MATEMREGLIRRYCGPGSVIILSFIVPVLLILFGIIPVSYRFHLLISATVLIAAFARRLGIS